MAMVTVGAAAEGITPVFEQAQQVTQTPSPQWCLPLFAARAYQPHIRRDSHFNGCLSATREESDSDYCAGLRTRVGDARMSPILTDERTKLSMATAKEAVSPMPIPTPSPLMITATTRSVKRAGSVSLDECGHLTRMRSHLRPVVLENSLLYAAAARMSHGQPVHDSSSGDTGACGLFVVDSVR